MLLDAVRIEVKSSVVDVVNVYKVQGGTIPVRENTLISIVSSYVMRPIKVVEENVSGPFLLALPDRFELILSNRRRGKDRRADIGHELGHALSTFSNELIGTTPRRLVGDYPRVDWDKEERACEQIGAYLFCPPSEVTSFIRSYEPDAQLCLPGMEWVRCLKKMSDHLRYPIREARDNYIGLEEHLVAMFGDETLADVMTRLKS